MKNNPLISIITVCFNGTKTIRQTIESILNQTYTNIEYILVDGKSTDNTVAIIEEYAPQFAANGISYRWISEPDSGIYDAMNKGIKLATGEWINIQGSDDWLELDACKHLFETLQSNSTAEVIYGLSKYYIRNKLYKIGQFHHTNLIESTLNHQSIFIKNTVHQKLGLYSTNYKLASDYEFLIRAHINKINFLFMPYIIANYNAGGASDSVSSEIETIKIKNKYKLINNLYSKLLYVYLKKLIKLFIHESK